MSVATGGVPAGRRARVLYVGTLPPHPGGSAISAFQLLVGLARRGHAIRALAPVTPETRTAADRFDAEHAALHVDRYELGRFDIGEPESAAPDHEAIEGAALRRHVPRLIMAHHPEIVLVGRESFGWHVPALARRHGVPSVLLLRGGAPTARLLGGHVPPHRVAEAVRRFSHARRLVAVSQHLADGFARLGLAGVEVVPNFVDPGRFTPWPDEPELRAHLGIPAGSVVVAHVGNLKARKRPFDVVAAAAIAARRDGRLVFLVVGDGPLRDAMVARCTTDGLTGHFRFAGWVDYEAMPALYRVADVVVLPTEAEGLARVYLETQATGRVLIASDIPPAREVVEPGVTGLLFPVGDVAALAAQVLRAAGDLELRERIGAVARRRVQTWALDGATRAYSTILDEAAAPLPKARRAARPVRTTWERPATAGRTATGGGRGAG